MNIESPGVIEQWLVSRKICRRHEITGVSQLAGGISNRTLQVRRRSGHGFVVKQALSKLRQQTDWFSNPGRIHREAAGLRVLGKMLPEGGTPRFIEEDQDDHILVMEAIPQPHDNWKDLLMAGRIDAVLVEQFASMLGQIHCLSSIQRDRLLPQFKDTSYFDSLRLEAYYEYSARQCPETAGFLTRLVRETRGRQVCLVHGDFSPKNVLIHHGRMVLLDHEVIHFGDPGFDIGFALTHFLGKAHFLPKHREAFATAAVRFWNTYAAHAQGMTWFSGLEETAINHTLACMLARVAGRSPLEYLNHRQRNLQKDIILEMIADPPVTVEALVSTFLDHLELNAAR